MVTILSVTYSIRPATGRAGSGGRFVTNSPQSETDRRREMRKTAGYKEPLFVANPSSRSDFVFVTLN